MRLLPLAVMLALSVRSPDEARSPTDWELSAGSRWTAVEAAAFIEREDGEAFWGYNLTGNRSVGSGWQVELKSRLKQAKDIDRQELVISYCWKKMSLGGGVTSREFSKPRGALDFRLPLPGGEMSYLTDLSSTHVFDGVCKLDFKASRLLKPFLIGLYYADGDLNDWQIKAGLEVMLE